MATDEQIKKVFQEMVKLHPEKFLKHMNETQTGLGAVMRLLYTEKEPITAGAISERLGISTARVAVLLKKLEAKGTITRLRDPSDARKTLVQLTDAGRSWILRTWEEIRAQMGKVIDTVGEERLLEFVEIGREIQQIMHQCPESFDEVEIEKERVTDDKTI